MIFGGAYFDTHQHALEAQMKKNIGFGWERVIYMQIHGVAFWELFLKLPVVWHQATSRAKWKYGHTNPEPIRSLCLTLPRTTYKNAKNPCCFRHSSCDFSLFRRMGPSGAQALSELALFQSPTILGTRDGRLRGAIWRIPKNWNWRVGFCFDFSQGVDTSKGHDQMIKRGWLVKMVKKTWVWDIYIYILCIYNIHNEYIYARVCVCVGGDLGVGDDMALISEGLTSSHMSPRRCETAHDADDENPKVGCKE